jgi:hypothetical protein
LAQLAKEAQDGLPHGRWRTCASRIDASRLALPKQKSVYSIRDLLNQRSGWVALLCMNNGLVVRHTSQREPSTQVRKDAARIKYCQRIFLVLGGK